MRGIYDRLGSPTLVLTNRLAHFELFFGFRRLRLDQSTVGLDERVLLGDFEPVNGACVLTFTQHYNKRKKTVDLKT